MKYRTSTEIRQLFLDFFKTKGHAIEPSSSLVPKDDPSLLWINSGVAALKKYFDGTEIPSSRRIVNAQKSLRANDIENVGVTARHHTLFEMLGNFSIGDYFRTDAIVYGWEFLTDKQWVGFDKDKLYVTVYPGDDETYDVWKNIIKLPEAQIVMCEDNFWEIGEGPCGPCTEIFYDRGPAFEFDAPKEELFVGGENDRYIEIWNIVLSQYNSQKGKTRAEYLELPTKNIDTGMGLERMVSIIQQGETNFETDLFLPIIAQIEVQTNIIYLEATPQQKSAFKLIADHTRAVIFAIADGALPSNEGRGYVIRRLLRRASRFAKKLGVHKPFLYELTHSVIDVMGGYYGYLYGKRSLIEKVIFSEEEKFLATLTDGEKKLEELLGKTTGNVLSGMDAFTLSDTYGFPIELTLECAQELGYSVNVDEFNKYLQEQKTRARNARVSHDSMQVQGDVLQKFDTKSQFVGYDTYETTAQALLIVKDAEAVKLLQCNEIGAVILNRTPFYAESGGQIYDTGTLVNERSIIRVNSVNKAPNGQFIHTVKVIEGKLDLTSEYTAIIDINQRKAIQKNHTATHLLQHILRTAIGAHIEQAGSSVDEKRLRFDFTHFEPLSQQQLQKIEQKVNELIWESAPVTTETLAIEEAKKLGAMALFGEKYGDMVRVVKAIDSIELCGGTHVENTAEIGVFTIVSESGIGSGVRRIEAVTSKVAYTHLKEIETIARNVQKKFKRKHVADIVDFAGQLVHSNKRLESELKQVELKTAQVRILEAINNPIMIGSHAVIIKTFGEGTIPMLKLQVDIIKDKLETYCTVLIGKIGEQTNIVIAVSKNQTEIIKSNLLVTEINTAFGSRGGGKAEIAQATADCEITEAEILAIVKANLVK
ncbi:MAG: alanine--tRNA ligase [Culicoidibacterales bacterium]